MKKTALSVLAIAAMVIACNNSNNNATGNTASANVPAGNSPYASGKGVYQRTCIICHQPDGSGMQNVYPPLAKSDFLLADKHRAIQQIILGSSNGITVNGNKYNSVMPPQNLKDEEIADVLDYVYHSFGNNGFTVTAADVKEVRDSISGVANNSPYAAGKKIYDAKCMGCHQSDGSASRTSCPPLAGSDYLLADKNRAIKQMINGTSEEITVNGRKYNGSMPPQQLSDEDAASVLNYITHSFGNNGYSVTAADIKAAK